MTSWEWVAENPVMTEKQFASFVRSHQFEADFVAECAAYRVEGGYDSDKVVGAAGY